MAMVFLPADDALLQRVLLKAKKQNPARGTDNTAQTPHRALGSAGNHHPRLPAPAAGKSTGKTRRAEFRFCRVFNLLSRLILGLPQLQEVLSKINYAEELENS